jgi:hypothetical protein
VRCLFVVPDRHCTLINGIHHDSITLLEVYRPPKLSR